MEDQITNCESFFSLNDLAKVIRMAEYSDVSQAFVGTMATSYEIKLNESTKPEILMGVAANELSLCSQFLFT